MRRGRGKNDLDEAQVTDVYNYRYASCSCVLHLIILAVTIAMKFMIFSILMLLSGS